MRILYPNLDFVKSIAKKVSFHTGRKLSQCQNAVASSSGYVDWHELEKTDLNFAVGTDIRYLSISDTSKLLCSLASKLEASVGDVQFAYSRISRSASPVDNMQHELDLRALNYRSTDIPDPGRRQPGAVGKQKGTDRALILKTFHSGGGAYCISNRSNSTMLADFEYVSPRNPVPLFIPIRLYVPYGIWKEKDGAQVIFSRDYLPLWRIRSGSPLERVSPMLWIDFVDQRWFWEDATTPWENRVRWLEAMKHLEGFGVKGLPKLVETLPTLIFEPKSTIKSAAEKMFGPREYLTAA